MHRELVWLAISNYYRNRFPSNSFLEYIAPIVSSKEIDTWLTPPNHVAKQWTPEERLIYKIRYPSHLYMAGVTIV